MGSCGLLLLLVLLLGHGQRGEARAANLEEQGDLDLDPLVEDNEMLARLDEDPLEKRSETSFKHLSVSVPTYTRLMNHQRQALRLDALMRKLASELPDLRDSQQWLRLLALRRSLQALLPENHPDFEWKTKRSLDMEFNGIQVSLPQYMRLTAMQRKVARLDALMQRIRSSTPPEQLENIEAWRKLVSLRKSLVRLLPMPQ